MTEHEETIELARIREMVAERRALELVRALRHAVSERDGWQSDGRRLLELIDGGVMPKPRHSVDFHVPDAA
jgi:hypothetical protein